MKSDCSAPSWLRFFMSAGIQKDSAETYAVTFSKNQIQLDMLPEIKKEYLVDMGITLMGHIIAILRHAKAVHTEEVTKSTLSTTKGGSAVASKVVAPVAKSVPKTTPVAAKEKPQVNSTTVKTVSSTSERPVAKSSAVPQPKSSSESTTVDKRKDKPTSEVSRTSTKSTVTKPIEPPVKRKLASDEAASPDESESKKRIFQRLGQTLPSVTPPPENLSNGDVFSRLGQRTPTSPPAEPMVIVTTKKTSIKPILSTPKTVVSPKQVITVNRNSLMVDPKKKVMMINKGVLTKTMRADQDVSAKILSSTSLSADHTSQTLQNSRPSKNNIYARLGKAAMDSEVTKPAAPASKVKRVSFGSVFEKTIPPVRKPQFCSFNDQPSFPSSPGLKKRAQSVGANGVFSRLGF